MASNQTSNYGLNQWAAADKVLREEFNQDNAKIDEALAQKAEQSALDATAATIPKIAAGTYIGNGTASQSISLGFVPKAVFTCTYDGRTFSNVNYGFLHGGLALPGHPVQHRYRENISSPYVPYTGVEITETGFLVHEVDLGDTAGIYCNSTDTVYHYLAMG